MPSQQDFCNAMFRSYLKYCDSKFGQDQVDEVIRSVGVKREWMLNHNHWHDIKFSTKFFQALEKKFPNETDLHFNVAKSSYEEKGQISRVFGSLTGLFLNPEIFLKLLPKGVERMNRYHTYQVELPNQALGAYFAKAKITQRPRDPAADTVNKLSCESFLGSMEGTFDVLGYKVYEFKESQCVRKGDNCCVYHVTWIKKTWFPYVFLAAVLSGGLLATIEFFPHLLNHHWILSLLLGVTAATAINGFQIRRKMTEAFNYQNETLNDLRLASGRMEEMNQELMQFQEKLSQAVSMASVGEMSYSVVHDMASPITLINLYNEELNKKLNKGGTPEEVAKISKSIAKATDRLFRMQQIFRQIAKSRGRTGTPTNIDIRGIAFECVELFQPFFEKFEVKIELDIPENPVKVKAPEGVLESVVLNLIQNALNAMKDQDEQTLSVKITHDFETTILAIGDNGPGLPEERAKDPFKQFGESKTQGGSGFGLYSIQQAVVKNGGKIDVETSSAGTKFIIEFPNANGVLKAS